MAFIKQLRDFNLVGGFCEERVYPMTSTSAVYSMDKENNPLKDVPFTLEERLRRVERQRDKGCDCTAIQGDLIDVLLNGATVENTSKECDCNK